MKRFASWVGCACLLAVSSLAHAEGYAGFRGGVNLASFTGDDAGDVSGTRTGFTGGGFLGFDVGNRLGFRADLLYTMKGATEDSTSIKLDYLELGTLLVGRLKLSQRHTLRLFVGPVLGLWVNAEADDGPNDIDIGDIVNHVEISGTLGAELNAQAGPYVLLLEARYTQGSRVFEDIGLDGLPLDFKVSNQGIGVMAGVMVPF